jgi:hypothetical protein
VKRIFVTALLALCGMAAFGQQRAAVLPFEVRNNAVSADEALVFYGDFNNRFSRVGRDSGLFSVVPRGDVEKLFRQEAAFQLSNLSDSKKTAEYGKALNADWLISGSISKAGTRIVFMISMYTYPDFTHLDGSQVYARNIDELIDKIPELIGDIQGSMTGGGGRPASRPETPAANTEKIYKIGDRGPAGGWIFYDKGTFSNGWRYLEAAPSETEFTAQWGAYNRDVSGTATTAGSGKRNTELIIERLRQLGENSRAAQLCASLNFDGHKDWFLPSKDELNLMYYNLKRKGLGGFSNGWYWSSSQYSNYFAWIQLLGDGTQVGISKAVTIYSIRAVRAF